MKLDKSRNAKLTEKCDSMCTRQHMLGKKYNLRWDFDGWALCLFSRWETVGGSRKLALLLADCERRVNFYGETQNF